MLERASKKIYNQQAEIQRLSRLLQQYQATPPNPPLRPVTPSSPNATHYKTSMTPNTPINDKRKDISHGVLSPRPKSTPNYPNRASSPYGMMSESGARSSSQAQHDIHPAPLTPSRIRSPHIAYIRSDTSSGKVSDGSKAVKLSQNY